MGDGGRGEQVAVDPRARGEDVRGLVEALAEYLELVDVTFD